MPFKLEWIPARGESLPFPDGFADSVAIAYHFCTIPHPQAPLAEIRRIRSLAGG